ncbi:anti-sigma factor [Lutibacter flavus]|uniref:Anti-sigma-K factor rskA n=1 Tax=Lutibacter flavus TaxID=691689 RepID=A0A238VIX2_9FLAO|nr:anti-sigma factor [Lutibacter flavus]SNR34342.1 Anti-sigma-K factor rskA [Lutibacter flavus]
MTRIFTLIALFTIAFSVSFCSDDDEPTTKYLTLNISGLENLGTDYVYEGWIIVGGNPISTGRFSVNDSGNLSQTSFTIDIEDLDAASTFVLTIEPEVGDNPAPSKVHILAGDFSGNSGQLSIGHGAALANNFSTANGKYILATPTNGADNDENSGVWFLDLSSGAPAVGLSLPTLPEGWKYEGWVVTSGTPVTSGKFTSVDAVDEFDGFSSTMDGPPFPGEDYLVNAPSGLTFPVDLSGGKAVISIEPDPDNSPNPFLLKPLVGDIPANAVDHTTYDLGQNLNFPTGTVSR